MKEENKQKKIKTETTKKETANKTSKKNVKKEEQVKAIKSIEEDKEKTATTDVIEEPIIQEKKKVTFLSILGLIIRIITFPVWFPWKILFVRRKGRKYHEVNTATKVFRIVRSPITKPLKFAIFIFILFIEISCLYKVRYSPITYTITRASVHDYYLKSEDNKKLLSLVDDVYAMDITKHRDEFQTAFNYIDEWGLNEKNKMYVILDSKAVKYVFKYAADEDITYLLTRFNTDENLRKDIKDLVQNINKLIVRGFNEASDMIPSYEPELKVIIEPFTTLGKTLDYTVFLNTIGNVIEVVESQSTPSVMKPNRTSDLEEMIDVIIKYSKGATLKELGDFDNYESDDELPSNRAEIITAN